MTISRLVSMLGAAVLLSGTALGVTSSRAQAQESSVFGSQQSSQGDIAASPDMKAPPLTVSGN